MAASATLALKPGVWFRRGRLLIVSPDSLGTACPLSGRNSTYRLVQILEAGSGGQHDDRPQRDPDCEWHAPISWHVQSCSRAEVAPSTHSCHRLGRSDS